MRCNKAQFENNVPPPRRFTRWGNSYSELIIATIITVKALIVAVRITSDFVFNHLFLALLPKQGLAIQFETPISQYCESKLIPFTLLEAILQSVLDNALKAFKNLAPLQRGLFSWHSRNKWASLRSAIPIVSVTYDKVSTTTCSGVSSTIVYMLCPEVNLAVDN